MELELLKDFFKVRVQFLKQKLNFIEKEKDEIEKIFVKERAAKDMLTDKCNQLETKAFES